MQIVNSLVENFGGFVLDTSAIGLRSISDRDIKLPYTGTLPKQMSPASSAYLYINVQLAQGVSVVLDVKMVNGEKLKRPLSVSSRPVRKFETPLLQLRQSLTFFIEVFTFCDGICHAKVVFEQV